MLKIFTRYLFILAIFEGSFLSSFSQTENYYRSFATPIEQAFGKTFIRSCFPVLDESTSAGLYKITQGYGQIVANRSMMYSPIKIGTKTYEHGLGTHAYSEIKVILPAKAKSFTAFVGKDVNEISASAPQQKLIFSILSKSKEIWRSRPLIVNEEAEKVNVPLNGMTEIILKVSCNDACNYGHADWADASIELTDGKKVRLGDMKMYTSKNFSETPFSFNYGGNSSRDFLRFWDVKTSKQKLSDKLSGTITWTNPEKNFQVRAEVTEYLNHPAVEWKLFFKNIGIENSQNLKNINSLDLNLSHGNKEIQKEIFGGPVPNKLHYNRGSDANRYDFQPLTELLLSNQPIKLNTRGGRSSERYLPFWNIDYNNFGLVTALGWSGSWNAEFNYSPNENQTNMKAGLMDVDLFLKPGEEIGVASVCLLYWEGADALRGNNLFRRYMKDTWVPKLKGKDPILVSMMGHPSSTTLETVNETNQLEYIKKTSETGSNAYWLDAGWMEDGKDGNWWNARGNWFASKRKFPNGLKVLSDEAHKNKMDFILWFDAECVMLGSDIAKKHPEWVIGMTEKTQNLGLYNLANPDAVQYMTDLVDSKIKQYGVDVFRTDYNIDPEYYWNLNEEPGRKGYTEIKYVEGLYQFWDELIKRNPGLLIDNCASGGRRLDYETSKRSVPFWRSDVEVFTDSLTMWESQNQTYGLSYFLPAHSTGNNFSADKYNYRSISSSSVAFGFERDPTKPLTLPIEEIKKVVTEINSYNYLFQADFYPLTDYCLGNSCWMALQYDSPERAEGVVTIFRREKAPYAEAEFELKALDPKAKYSLSFIDTGKEISGTGAEIKKIIIRLDKRQSAVVKYKKVK